MPLILSIRNELRNDLIPFRWIQGAPNVVNYKRRNMLGGGQGCVPLKELWTAKYAGLCDGVEKLSSIAIRSSCHYEEEMDRYDMGHTAALDRARVAESATRDLDNRLTSTLSALDTLRTKYSESRAVQLIQAQMIVAYRNADDHNVERLLARVAELEDDVDEARETIAMCAYHDEKRVEKIRELEAGKATAVREAAWLKAASTASSE
jgi:hypothetical protein